MDEQIFTAKGTVKINCIYYHDEAPNPSETPTESATKSPTESPTESATESISQSPDPYETPPPTETPLPSATEKLPELIIVNESDVLDDKRLFRMKKYKY